MRVVLGVRGYIWACTDIFGPARVLLKRRYFWVHTGTFKCVRVILGTPKYFWGCAGNLGSGGTFGCAQLILGMHGYFLACAGTFACMQVLLSKCGYFGRMGDLSHQGSFGTCMYFQKQAGTFGVWGSFWACTGTFGHTRVLLSAWVLFGMLW